MDRSRDSRSPRQGRRQRDRQASGHGVRVVAVRREPPDIERFVAALLALALAEREADRRRATGEDRPVEQSSG